jgi:ankyrin repeat protein
MTSALPDHPDLQLEKKQAKALLKAYRAGDAPAVARMQAQLPRLADEPRAALADAQFVLARERGFDSWPKLKAHIESRRPLADQVIEFVRAACNGRHASAARLLAKNHAIVEHSVHAACAAADATAVAAILDRDPGALTAPQPRQGGEPLVYACASHMHKQSRKLAAGSVRCVKLLLERGADPNAFTLVNPAQPDGDKLSVLYRASVANNAAVVKLLLERGARVNDGESVYHAAELNHRECLEHLLAHGAEISARQQPWDNTVLYFVVLASGSVEGARWLLEHGADPNVPSTKLDETPLQRAAAQGAAAMVELLVAHGADPHAKRSDGRSSYSLAFRSGNREVLKTLQAAGARTDELTAEDRFVAACRRADEAEARTLLAASPGLIDALPAEDRAAFTGAAGEGQLDAVRVMAALGFDVAWQHPNGGTALHWAAWQGRVDVVRLLVQLGAPVNVRDSTYGSTPVAWAAHGSVHCRAADADYLACVDMLIDAGSDLEPALNKWGEPPHKLASRRVRDRLVARGFVPREASARG